MNSWHIYPIPWVQPTCCNVVTQLQGGYLARDDPCCIWFSRGLHKTVNLHTQPLFTAQYIPTIWIAAERPSSIVLSGINGTVEEKQFVGIYCEIAGRNTMLNKDWGAKMCGAISAYKAVLQACKSSPTRIVGTLETNCECPWGAIKHCQPSHTIRYPSQHQFFTCCVGCPVLFLCETHNSKPPDHTAPVMKCDTLRKAPRKLQCLFCW